jgi:hypothetical protein
MWTFNGKELKLGSNDSIPSLTGAQIDSGRITLPPASVTFLAVSERYFSKNNIAEFTF